jgi:hypothetical protein
MNTTILFPPTEPAGLSTIGGQPMLLLRPHIVCNDGLTFSMQASRFHYCTPRVDNAETYTEVEIGLPSRRVDLWMPYIDTMNEDTDPTRASYAYVPTHLVVEAIEQAGGLSHLEPIR